MVGRVKLSRCPCGNPAWRGVLNLLLQQTSWPGGAEGQGCARSAVNTWQGQNPSGGEGAPPDIAVIQAGTTCSCQKLRLVSGYHKLLLLYKQLRCMSVTLQLPFCAGQWGNSPKSPQLKAASTADACPCLPLCQSPKHSHWVSSPLPLTNMGILLQALQHFLLLRKSYMAFADVGQKPGVLLVSRAAC